MIPSHRQFKKVTAEHRARLSESLEFLLLEFKKNPNFEANFFIDYFRLHDLPKLLPIEDLEIFGYTHELDLGTRLAEFYGKNKNDLVLEERNKLLQVIGELNKVERLQKKLFLNSLRTKKPKSLAFLFQLEHFLDLFDTEYFRAREFGTVQLFQKYDNRSSFEEWPVLERELYKKWKLAL